MSVEPGAPSGPRPWCKVHMASPDQSARWIGVAYFDPGRGSVISRCGRWVYRQLGEPVHERPYPTTCLACAHSWRKGREPAPPLKRIVFSLNGLDPAAVIEAAAELDLAPHEFAWECLRDRITA